MQNGASGAAYTLTFYEVETKALNQAVKRNYKRFEGEEFIRQLQLAVTNCDLKIF